MTTPEFIFALIGAIATILGGVWFIVTRVFSKGMDKQHFMEFEEKVNNNLEKIDVTLESLEETVNDHTMALVEIYSFLGQKYPKYNFMFAMKKSPRTLNPLGERIFNEIDGDTFLKDNKDVLFEYIDKEEPKTRFDVEAMSFKALSMYSSDESFNKFKNYIYDAPALELEDGKKYELGLGDICFILSLPLRDMYIEERNVQ